MATWYRIHSYQIQIDPVEVIKETAEMLVWIDDSWSKKRETRSRKGGVFFPTFEEARAYLVEQLQRRLQNVDGERSRVIAKIKKARELTLGISGKQ